LQRAALEILKATPGVEIEYVAAVDAATLQPLATLDRPVVVAIAVRIGATRLIDNITLGGTRLGECSRAGERQ
jgi:pantoate--beta-alanine ligase